MAISCLFSCAKTDYHKLIGVAAELVDSLEDTVRGKMVSWIYHMHATC